MIKLRKRLYEIVEVSQDNDKLSALYDGFMMVLIIVSIIPLAFKENNLAFTIIDKVAAGCFCIDYLLRLITAGYMEIIGKEKEGTC